MDDCIVSFIVSGRIELPYKYNCVVDDGTALLTFTAIKGRGKVLPRTGHEGPGGSTSVDVPFL
jgi:hypothetical protein